MIQTVDFFTPVVDDPVLFGRIAAANALSDVWAMGATPAVALAVAAFPVKVLPLEMLGEIFRGAAEAAAEVGVEIAGGHSIDADVPMYGLSVTGFCAEDELWRNGGARAGDDLVLTKPLGTGVLTAAYRAWKNAEADPSLPPRPPEKRFDPADEASFLANLSTMNGPAAATARPFGVRAATDVTGFGLAGHLHEMAENSGLAVDLDLAQLPLLSGLRRLLAAGVAPGGTKRNLQGALAGGWLVSAEGVDDEARLVVADAQTNGGLLFALPGGEGERLVEALRRGGVDRAALIGRFREGRAGEVRLAGGLAKP